MGDGSGAGGWPWRRGAWCAGAGGPWLCDVGPASDARSKSLNAGPLHPCT